jgi:hypothetical protein
MKKGICMSSLLVCLLFFFFIGVSVGGETATCYN